MSRSAKLVPGTPTLTLHELSELRQVAERSQYQRGSAGVWSRRCLKLLDHAATLRQRLREVERFVYDEAAEIEQPEVHQYNGDTLPPEPTGDLP